MAWFGKDKKPKMIERESKMFDVIQNLVTQPDCVIEINPEDMTYMLSLEKEQYFLYIDGTGVQFSNHECNLLDTINDKLNARRPVNATELEIK